MIVPGTSDKISTFSVAA